MRFIFRAALAAIAAVFSSAFAQNLPLSSLPAASALSTADLFYVVQGGASKKATGTQLQTLIGTSGSPLTTKCDLWTYSTVNVRLGCGANGTFLKANSAQATGLQWVTPAFSDLSGNIAISQMNSGTSASSSTYWRGDGTWSTVSGASGGTVTNTGTLTSSRLVIGNGSADVKTVAGLTTDGVSKVTFGEDGVSDGALSFQSTTGATGAVKLQPVTGALGTNTVSIPATTGTLLTDSSTATVTNKSIDAGQLTGTIAAGRMPALTGDVTTSAGAVATTLATVNSNVGTYGSATKAPVVTVNGKGLVTAASESTVTPAVGSITGLGTGVATALGNATNGAGGVVTADGTATLTNKTIAGSQVTGAATSSGLTMSTARVLCRTTASSGAIEECSAGTGITLSAGSISASGGGSGTVTHTGGALTANAVVLGAGTDDTKVVAGITTDGTSAVNLGVAGTSVGKVVFANATSGTGTLQPPTGALGTITYTLPGVTSTLSTLGGNNYTGTQNVTNASANAATLILGGAADANKIVGDPLHLVEIINNATTSQVMRFSSYGSAASVYQNDVHWYRANGTLASPSAVLNGDVFLSFGTRGHDGTVASSSSATAFEVRATENWSSSAHGSKFVFSTTPTGGTTRSDVVTIDTGINTTGTFTTGAASGSAGAVLFKGSTSGTATLTVGAAAGTPTITLPTATGTLATLAGTETFTNKSIAGSQITGAYTSAGLSMATDRLLGRTTASSGAVEEISIGSGLTLSAGTLSNSGTLSNPMTTAGDIIYGGASGTPTRLAGGTSGQVLTSNGATSAPSWQAATGGGSTYMGASAVATATQSISNSTWTAITLDSESSTYQGHDTNSIHNTSSNTSRFTVPSGGDGYWQGYAMVYWENNQTGSRWIAFQKNGSELYGSSTQMTAASTTNPRQQATMPPTYLVAGDYIEAFVLQNSGATRTIGDAAPSTVQTKVAVWRVGQ